MKNKLMMFLFVWVTIFLNACDLHATQTNSDSSTGIYNEMVKDYYPNYVLMDQKEVDPFAMEFFRDNYPKLNPCVVTEDFDGNGLYDFAFLLSTDNKERTILAIIMQFDKNVFNKTFSVDLESYRTDVAIVPVDKKTLLKQAEAIDEDREDVLLKNPGVELIYVGKSAVVYYWDNETSQFQSIWISD